MPNTNLSAIIDNDADNKQNVSKTNKSIKKIKKLKECLLPENNNFISFLILSLEKASSTLADKLQP